MKSSFKLLKLKDNDYITACTNTSINEGINSPNPLVAYNTQLELLCALINLFNEDPEDMGAFIISSEITKLLALIDDYYAPFLDVDSDEPIE